MEVLTGHSQSVLELNAALSNPNASLPRPEAMPPTMGSSDYLFLFVLVSSFLGRRQNAKKESQECADKVHYNNPVSDCLSSGMGHIQSSDSLEVICLLGDLKSVYKS